MNLNDVSIKNLLRRKGKAAFVLAGALIGWGRRVRLRDRLRQVVPDVATLAFGMSVFLVWAGIVEAFLSQYHEPVVPYALKIAFGSVQLVLVLAFFAWSGRGRRWGGSRGEPT